MNPGSENLAASWGVRPRRRVLVPIRLKWTVRRLRRTVRMAGVSAGDRVHSTWDLREKTVAIPIPSKASEVHSGNGVSSSVVSVVEKYCTG